MVPIPADYSFTMRGDNTPLAEPLPASSALPVTGSCESDNVHGATYGLAVSRMRLLVECKASAVIGCGLGRA